MVDYILELRVEKNVEVKRAVSPAHPQATGNVDPCVVLRLFAHPAPDIPSSHANVSRIERPYLSEVADARARYGAPLVDESEVVDGFIIIDPSDGE